MPENDKKSLWFQFLDMARKIMIPNPRWGDDGITKRKVSLKTHIDYVMAQGRSPGEDALIKREYSAFKKHHGTIKHHDRKKKAIRKIIRMRAKKRKTRKADLEHLNDPDLAHKVFQRAFKEGDDPEKLKRHIKGLVKKYKHQAQADIHELSKPYRPGKKKKPEVKRDTKETHSKDFYKKAGVGDLAGLKVLKQTLRILESKAFFERAIEKVYAKYPEREENSAKTERDVRKLVEEYKTRVKKHIEKIEKVEKEEASKKSKKHIKRVPPKKKRGRPRTRGLKHIVN